MIYSSWDIECDRLKLVIMGHFLHFYPPPIKKPKNQNLKKMKKVARDIIILHKCTKNHNYMRCSSWDTEWDRQNFLLFWAIFCHFTPLITRKIKILQTWKKHLEMSSFYTCALKITTIWCVFPEIWNMTDNFLSFFALLPHYWPQK